MTYGQGGIAILGGMAVLVALCMVVIRIEKRSPDTEYDERQKQVRGNAYRISFYVSFAYFLALLYCVGLGVFDEMESVATLLFTGVVIQMMVFHIYCLLAHAALPLSDKGKPWRAIWGHAGLSAMNFGNFGMGVFLDGRYAKNASGGHWRNLILAIAFGLLALMHLIQYLRDRRDSCE